MFFNRVQSFGTTQRDGEQSPGASLNVDEKVEIVDSVYLGDYRLQLKFGDGREQEVDFNPFLTGSQHPAIRRYLDTKVFRSYTLRHGNIDWNDYDLVFPVADLYRGEI